MLAEVDLLARLLKALQPWITDGEMEALKTTKLAPEHVAALEQTNLPHEALAGGKVRRSATRIALRT